MEIVPNEQESNNACTRCEILGNVEFGAALSQRLQQVQRELEEVGADSFHDSVDDEAFDSEEHEEEEEEEEEGGGQARRPAGNSELDDAGGLSCRAQRQRVVERALGTKEQDNERLLHCIRQRLHRVGMELPKVEVRFEDLCVNADVYVGNRALPTIPNFFRNWFETLLASLRVLPSMKRDFAILHNVSGVIKPGRMTLLLGPPGSGKSSLLLALAGKLDKDLRSSGRITYNGHTLGEFIPERTAAYVSQIDKHIGELTVRETLDFAQRCQGVGYQHDMFVRLRRREKQQSICPDPDIDAFMQAQATDDPKRNLTTDYILKVLGLEICADTLVGNDMIRGISGGQKKRVTTGEMLVGPKKTLFMDEISTGLDSSTTFQIVKCMRNFAHLLEGTVFMALLQPPPETFNLFDDIVLLSEGHIVYHGPREKTLNHFEGLGFKLPPRKGIADFLQEITSRKDQAQYWADMSKPYEFIPVAQMAAYFKESKVGKELATELTIPYEKGNSHAHALVTTKYALEPRELVKVCTEREWLLIKRNKFLYIFRTCQVGVVACITATLYLKTWLHPKDEVSGSIYLSALFFSLIHMMFNGFSEMSITVSRLPVLYHQRDNMFYPTWAFSIPSWILRIPYSLTEAIIWSCIVCYSIGLTPQTDRFFKFMLLLFLMHQMAIAMFRLIGALGRSMVIANAFGSCAILVVFLLGGFILAKDSIHPWWIWAFWVSPLSYAQNAIAVNEFLAPRWHKRSLHTGKAIYKSILRERGLFHQEHWYWVGVGVLIGYLILFNILVIFALKYLQPLGKSQATVSRDSMSKQMDNLEDQDALEPQFVTAQNSSSDEEPGDRKLQKHRGYVKTIGIRHMAFENLSNILEPIGNTAQSGLILPFEPLTLTFHNLCYYVDMPSEMKNEGASSDKLQLLQNVSGSFKPGVLTALVGVSGAGKTTLMDVLAGRKTEGYIEGEIRVSGFPKKQETFARICGYVEQTDIHSPQVTIHESLIYSSWLRLSSDIDASTRQRFVEQVMELVELNSLRQALVGLPGTTGLSTEQRKRLTIAVELVANPSIIFLDEPTSGLDARAAAIVMRTIRSTVDTGRTVVCTIHQPSIDIFEAFDELLLLKHGGYVIYAGPLGEESNTMVRYFEAINGVSKIKEGQNPATWMLDISTFAAESHIQKDLSDTFKNSKSYSALEAEIKRLREPISIASCDLEFLTKYSQSFHIQFIACLWKQHLTYWRSPYYNAVRFVFTLVCALIFGSIFWGLGSKRTIQKDILNVMGALYSGTLLLGVQNASTVQPIVAIERSVFYREKAARMYGALPYALAQGLIELPYILVQTIAYAITTYSMIKYESTTEKFFWYTTFLFLSFTYFTMYGILAIGVTSTQTLAAILCTAFYSLWNLFSGFLIPEPKMPSWWHWYYWFVPVQWTIDGLVASQLGDIETKIYAFGYGVIPVKDYIHNYFGYSHNRLGVALVILMGFACLFWLVFAFSIKIINFQRR